MKKNLILTLSFCFFYLNVFSQTVNVGLIGCGFRGTGALNDIIAASEITGIKVNPVAFCDFFRRKAILTAKKYNKTAAVYFGADGYRKMMADPNVHAVILATPPNFRPLHFEAAVLAKKHIFEEKPVAVDPLGCRRHLAAAFLAISNNLTVVAGTQRRHDSRYVDQFNAINSGKIGNIIGGNIVWNTTDRSYGDEDFPNYKEFRDKRHGNDKNNKNHFILNWYYYKEFSGDHLVEQHIHNIDVANWFIGRPPVSVTGFGGRLKRKSGNINDFFQLEFDYGEGVKITSSCRQINNLNRRVGETFNTSTGYTIEGGKQIHKNGKIFKDDNRRDDIKTAAISPYVYEQVNFLLSITERSTYYMEAVNVTMSTAAAVAGRLAADTGKTVMIYDMLFNEKYEFYHMNSSIQPEDFETKEILEDTTIKR